MNMEELVQTYIKIREKKSQLKTDYELEAAKFSQVQDKIEALLLHKFEEMGVDSVKTPAGTAYSSVRSNASLADWDSFRAFCAQQEDPYEYIERRVSKTAVEQYRAAHDDLPPGINWSETRVVNFRRS
jgi:hypothetical protein